MTDRRKVDRTKVQMSLPGPTMDALKKAADKTGLCLGTQAQLILQRSLGLTENPADPLATQPAASGASS